MTDDDFRLDNPMLVRWEFASEERLEKRNQIYRSLGLPEVEVDIFTESVQEGDTIILCTDGLCGVVEDEDLRSIVEHYDPEESAQYLIARANEAGGPDNVTAIVVCVSA